MKIYKQEKTDEELDLVTNKIIDICRDLNPAERYKVISSLYHGLIQTLKIMGIVFEMKEDSQWST